MSAKARFKDALLVRSLDAAARSQGLLDIRARLEAAVPDITDQYTEFAVDTPYLERKVRNQHAFQMSLVASVMESLSQPTVVDIGDSAGTHLRYMAALFPQADGMTCLSVNLDPAAVERIRSRGFEAVCMRAEELAEHGVTADVFLCFEALEHFMDPCRFLHSLAMGSSADYLIVTVPFVEDSRVGLHNIRNGSTRSVSAENQHIFELDPEDWRLLARQAGWEIVRDAVYRQYPAFGLTRLTRRWWRKRDYEGFYGMILRRDDTWSSRYTGW